VAGLRSDGQGGTTPCVTAALTAVAVCAVLMERFGRVLNSWQLVGRSRLSRAAEVQLLHCML
jgi:hypothetical protein